MPFGKYADFDACVADQSKDNDVEAAKAICGKMQAEMGGSNFVEHTIDASGDLYLKYFFADASITERPSAVGHFSLDKAILPTKDTEAVGLPFTILPRQDLSLKGDWHPWSPKEGATWDDHITFAKSYSPGHIVAITPQSKLIGASIDNIKQNNGRFAIVQITDKRARDAFVSNPSLIPKAVSPGFMNLEAPNLDSIRNFKWVHLAAVPRGAYGDKATVYASCLGGNECVNHLVGASVAQLDEQLKNTYCPIGASEIISSLGNSNTPLQSMSDTANAVPSTTTTNTSAQPVSTTAPKIEPQAQSKAPINAGTPKQGIVRLKQPSNQAVTPQGNNQAQGQPQEDDLGKLKEEVAKMREIQQMNERREQIKKLVPKELFINKGKFDEKAFEAEVEKRLQSGASDEQINELYTLWMDKQKLINAGFTAPIESLNQPNALPQAPTGGSASYQTPSEVPESNVVGGSSEIDALRLKAVNSIFKWSGLR